MRIVRAFISLTVVLIFLLLTGTVSRSGSPVSLSPLTPSVARAGWSAPVDYRGRLLDLAGENVPSGAYDFVFNLYSLPTGGELLWSETHTGVKVEAGAFATPLGSLTSLPGSMQSGQVWLEVKVRGPNETSFTQLDPRQDFSTYITPQGVNCPQAVATDTDIYLSPQAFILRANPDGNMPPGTLDMRPMPDGSLYLESISTGVFYLSLPLQVTGKLNGVTQYVKSLDVCLSGGGYPMIITSFAAMRYPGTSNDMYAQRIGEFQTNGCYSITAPIPRKAVTTSSWVQLNVRPVFDKGSSMLIQSVRLTLTNVVN